MLFDPDLVDLSLLPPDREATLDGDGIWGRDARDASADEGAAILALFLERTVPTIQKLLDRHTP